MSDDECDEVCDLAVIKIETSVEYAHTHGDTHVGCRCSSLSDTMALVDRLRLWTTKPMGVTGAVVALSWVAMNVIGVEEKSTIDNFQHLLSKAGPLLIMQSCSTRLVTTATVVTSPRSII